jgi:hypothetical protein
MEATKRIVSAGRVTIKSGRLYTSDGGSLRTGGRRLEGSHRENERTGWRSNMRRPLPLEIYLTTWVRTDRYTMERRRGEEAIEKVMRAMTHVSQGRMRIQKAHVDRTIKTNKLRSDIGAKRADKVWAWVANQVKQGNHSLRDTSQWTDAWMGEDALETLAAKGDAAWSPGDRRLQARAHRTEVVGTVRTWLRENEEQGEGKAWKLRPPKLAELHQAKKSMAKGRGGVMAIYAALALLTADGELALTRLPERQSRKGPWEAWIQDSVNWMRRQGWVSDREATETKQKATAAQSATNCRRPKAKHVVVDFGEGWRGVGRTISAELPDVEVVGVDRRGFTNTGALHGTIISAVHHDFQEDTGPDLMTAVQQKVRRGIPQWLLAWMSPDCSLHSIANAINQPKGAAHGKWARSIQNTGATTKERVEDEEGALQESIKGARRLLEGLEAHPTLLFAMENPWTSNLWKEPQVAEVMRRNKTWSLKRVDQCAFGRTSQKPTGILTNIAGWSPKGATGKGRCIVGRCAGTRDNKPGDKRHETQTVANSRERRQSQGALIGGRREFARQAVTNQVAPGLVKEIVEAAQRDRAKQACRERGRKRARDTEGPPLGGQSRGRTRTRQMGRPRRTKETRSMTEDNEDNIE